MSVRGMFTMTFSGPLGTGAQALRALTAAGFAARTTDQERPDVPDAAWVVAEIHNGQDGSPDGEQQREWMERAAAAVGPLGWQARSHGVVMGEPADLQVLRHRETGQEVCRGWFGNSPDLGEIAATFGLAAADVELVNDDAIWRIPAG